MLELGVPDDRSGCRRPFLSYGTPLASTGPIALASFNSVFLWELRTSHMVELGVPDDKNGCWRPFLSYGAPLGSTGPKRQGQGERNHLRATAARACP